MGNIERMLFVLQEQRSLKAGDLSHQENNNMAASTMKLQSDSFTSEKVNETFCFRLKVFVENYKTLLDRFRADRDAQFREKALFSPAYVRVSGGPPRKTRVNMTA